MFEKSLYDLIRGLRNHKGNERQYIENSIRECRKEIRSLDMDLKATALLKLTYLEMFGHDMSWASFNVLEVMSSTKFLQKRVGYLGAVQSFRTDTEVMMLAENLLKKDLGSTTAVVISLPLTTIPHLLGPSMANSLLADLLPRLTHSNPSVRKKTIVTLYRLALVYPDTLRPAWPKIKDRLTDDSEEPSVTAAIVNVICELGWRRPQDFLPLAPRLFDLLVDGGNNWMAIKIIKLFAVLTPLEPRLVKKLLAPLITLIKTTPAMSLLYECINGIIHGGILDTASGSTEGDEVARLCVAKLRGMIIAGNDPTLKYVALLAFNKIVQSHPFLVSSHEDVILECIDDADVSIRIRATELASDMINPSNLVSIVERLLEQLKTSPVLQQQAQTQHQVPGDIVMQADMATMDDDSSTDERTPLPDEYRADVVSQILDMCSRDTYANINDFEWYLDVLVSLIQHVPISSALSASLEPTLDDQQSAEALLSLRIGNELRNIAVRVPSMRSEAVARCDRVVSVDQRTDVFGRFLRKTDAVLEPCAFVVGEYASYLEQPSITLTSLIHSDSLKLPSTVLFAFVQAAVKVFARVATYTRDWSAERSSMMTLLLSRIIYFLEPLTLHSSLQIQELAVGYLELMRLASEAVKDTTALQPPILLAQAIPALFSGTELNPVSKDAQRKVPLPDDLDFDADINSNLHELLNVSAFDLEQDTTDDSLTKYYFERPRQKIIVESASKRLEIPASYQLSTEPDSAALRQLRELRDAEKRDDPFYIASSVTDRTATPIHEILRESNGDELDVDSIPIMELDLSGTSTPVDAAVRAKRPPRKHVEILTEETLDGEFHSSATASSAVKDGRRGLLGIDSSGLGALSLSSDQLQTSRTSHKVHQLEVERREAEEQEMNAALLEVERLRVEMQRAQDRIEASREVVVSGRPKVKPKKKKASTKSLPASTSEKATVPAHVDDSPSNGLSSDARVDDKEVEVTDKPKKKKKKQPSSLAENVSQETGTVHADTEDTEVKPKKKSKPKTVRRTQVIL